MRQARHPTLRVCLAWRGFLFLLQGSWPEAFRQADEVISSLPDTDAGRDTGGFQARLVQAWALEETGDLEQAQAVVDSELTTTGRRTGRRRTTPLLYVADGDNMVVAASNAGNTRHPAWWLNLERNPEAEVQIRRETMRVRAEAATGDERERLWRRFLESYSGYKDYEKTAGREIPVVILRPVN